ncbi:MAG: hypothetical protein ACFB0C_06915 [Leptolyngbyaceae cyanobacterium]
MMRHLVLTRFAIAAIATLSLLTGCNQADTAEVSTPAEVSTETASPTATPEASGNTSPADAAPTPTADSPTNTTAAPTAAPVSAPQPEFEYQPPRLLTLAELNWAEESLPYTDQDLIIDQSFWLDTRDMGEVAFVATQIGDDLELLLLLPHGEISQVLPPNEDAASWILWGMKAVTFLELDFDGAEPDIIVLADYITGVGPTGSEPFTVATVYLNQGDYFTTDPSVNRYLTDRNVQTLAEAEDILRNELDFLP